MQVLSPPVQLGFKRDAWLFVLIIVGVALTLFPWQRVTASDWVFWLTWFGLASQLAGFIVMAYRQARDVLPEFKDASRKFAMELDEHFAERERILAWLRSIPAEVRQPRRAYVEIRLETLRGRYPVLFGAVDRLGVLPVLVAVFIQYQALQSVSGVAMFLGLAIVVLYLMSLWMIRFRTQLETYVRVLRAADESLA